MDDPYRRPNGRPQACEPCRKRKVSCDHTHPICRRCIKRNQQSECIYVLQDSSRPPPRPRAAATPAAARARVHTLPVSPPRTNESGSTPQLSDLREEPTPVATDTGYVGSTNFCHFYKEAEQILQAAQAGGPQYNDTLCGCHTSATGLTFEDVRDKCDAVLALLPDLSEGIETFRQHECSSDSMPPAICMRIVQSICDTIGPYLGPDRNPQQLEAIARKLCRNTSKPLSDNEPVAEKWISQFIGDNLRWESIGIIFTLWQRRRPPSKLAVVPRGSRFKNWAHVARKGLALTLELCTEMSKGSFICLYFAQKLTVAESMFSGDSSLRTWRVHGDTVAMLTFLGYHAAPDVQPYVPTLTSELKRRLYGWVLNMDCSVAYFTGRPPLMSSQYGTTPLPLDLHDDELLDPVMLPLAVSQLDNGWKRDATKTNAGTFTRARSMMGSVRESVAAIAIGHSKPSSLEMLLDIKPRTIQTYASFPPILQFRPKHLDIQAFGTKTLYSQLLIRLEYLQTLLFAERLLLRHHVKEDRVELVSISFELVSATLLFWTHNDRLGAVDNDAEWLVMAFAAPAGGVLCHELLTPSVDLRSAFGTSEAGSPTATAMPYRLDGPPITRASIIQKLSLLVGFLDWIRPSAPNADICCEAKVVIQAVLDQALNNPCPPRDAEPLPLTFAPEFSDWDLNTVLDFNCDLLDTFDWLRP
ncbi:hypothetical protein Micbo1qcDRAFT_148688 [Microdochium bolleyi]|uniref:Zn(2)-C6 fungal-type domain-containing protein n=1 Tax=Microdochium bolleyi TaxID=196109 RepID=A0A136J0L2_9PEZI|nr:hypothetical protein Micbo1qcDRAFT_148688 [Microdochium bolleyi]